MNLKWIMITIFLLALTGYAAFSPFTDPKEKEAVILDAILKVQQSVHFKENQINDEFSEKVFDMYLESMDYGKRFLTKEDLNRLEPFKKEIDNQSLTGQLEFFELSLEIIENAIDRSESYFEEIIDRPFDYSKEEYFETLGEKREWKANDEELKEFWRQMLKYETVYRLTSKLEKIEKQKEEGKLEEEKSWDELEEEARNKVKDNFEKWFDRMEDIRRSDRFGMFANSLTHVWDPHSDYYSPKEKEDFDINMSGRLEGIGARLQTDGDFTKVVSIIPGGPAWKQKELEVDDLISAVLQEGDETPTDVTGLRIDDVVKLIRGKKGTKVTLSVKKKDGSLEDITIERDEVIIDEGFAKSFIVDHEEVNGKIGYIFLPRFYTNFNSPNGPKSSRDMKKAIEKMNEEGVDGIILDLRNNGGGSLPEVIDISGLFIEKGPIVQVKNRKGTPYVYQDKDPKVHYKGPLVVLVNTSSASASEILAAALQDYDRALIVGSPSTFGKGTVQRFYDLDRIVTNAGGVKPLGELKLTTQKYYRVNGGSVQLRGVEPDIVLPDRYAYVGTGEKEYDYAMDWTQIDPVDFSQETYRIRNEEILKINSANRVNQNEVFASIDADAKRIKSLREETKFPLKLEEYKEVVKRRRDESKKFEDIYHPIEELKIANLNADMAYITMDSSRIARNDDLISKLKKDVYLEEAMFIINDMLGPEKP